jgi:hypothetical protein
MFRGNMPGRQPDPNFVVASRPEYRNVVLALVRTHARHRDEVCWCLFLVFGRMNWLQGSILRAHRHRFVHRCTRQFDSAKNQKKHQHTSSLLEIGNMDARDASDRNGEITDNGGMTVTIDDVRAAAAAIKGQVVDTPCLHSRTLSEITGV